jgi:amidophosphoribosyltransferase
MTNNQELFENLVKLGQHPKSKVDSVTVMEKIGHFLDDAVHKIYKDLKKEGFNKQEASPLIEKRLKISKVLKKASRDWDGGYAMAGLLGHGDAFVLRDPSAIRPAYYYKDDEVVVVASERPVIQTVFNTAFEEIKELEAGHSIIIKKSGKTLTVPILEKKERKACSFERIYFSRGSDKEIYLERKKLGELLFPKILQSINSDLKNTVFSYIPNTAETSFFGLVQEAQKFISSQAIVKLLEEKQEISKENLEKLFSLKPRIEKVAIKDAKLRTFIADDANRDELVAHVYDITYGSIKKTDTLVIIDDSIVRGTTLQKSILKILDRLNPKKIVVVSSAPQIRYPDCYGIDMAKMEDFIAFRAAIALLKSEGKEDVIKETYKECLKELKLPSSKMKNKVKKIYIDYTDEDISNQISKLLKEKEIKTDVQVIFQTVESLHSACPKNLGDWYFTGNYPTQGGNKVVNQSFVNYYEGSKKRAY